ncbi:hemerythrin domain-containing protein [Rhodococcus gannanensis]|uniref:Hemerythrin domain-containing protein n=1 Tax=Rhodococcus gannanensis TaxID=1960308 RepID=A0ABW4P2H8_9NOCA
MTTTATRRDADASCADAVAAAGCDADAVAAVCAVDDDTARCAADVVLARRLADHHAQMVTRLDWLSAALVDAATDGDAAAAHSALRGWVRDELVPHAQEEERTLYPAAAELAEGALLIRSMIAEHGLIRATASAMSDASDPAVAGAYGRALFHIFDDHQWKENELILPLLVESASVSLVEVMSADECGCGHRDH